LAAIALRNLARTAPGARDQCLPPSRENASRAAATAISTSSAVAAGMSPSPFTAHTKQNAEFSSALAVCCRSGRGRATGGSAAGRTDGGLGGRVDDGEAAPERRLPPAPADEEAAARDRRLRGHDNAIDGPEPGSVLLLLLPPPPRSDCG